MRTHQYDDTDYNYDNDSTHRNTSETQKKTGDNRVVPHIGPIYNIAVSTRKVPYNVRKYYSALL